MEQLKGYENGCSLVCRLKKSLYGLKQASRAWNLCFTDFLKKFGLTPMVKHSCVFVSKKEGASLIIAIYVDDGLIACSDPALLKQVLDYLKTKFEITVMDASCFVGLQIQRDRKKRTLTISQENYIKKIVDRFELSNAVAPSTPMDSNTKYCRNGVRDGEDGVAVDVPYRELIGSLMYASTQTRIDITYATNLLARYMEAPRRAHWNAAKRVLCYLKGTASLGLKFSGSNDDEELVSYSDSDHAADIDSRKSVSGYFVKFYGAPITWKSSKQDIVAVSTTEAEFISASLASREIMWTRQFLSELGRPVQVATELQMDSQGAIRPIENPQTHTKNKHVDIKYMMVLNLHETNQVRVSYVNSKAQVADTLTKALARDQFLALRDVIDIVCVKKRVIYAQAATGCTSDGRIVSAALAETCSPSYPSFVVSDHKYIEKIRSITQTNMPNSVIQQSPESPPAAAPVESNPVNMELKDTEQQETVKQQKAADQTSDDQNTSDEEIIIVVDDEPDDVVAPEFAVPEALMAAC